MDKANIFVLVQSIEHSLHLMYKNRLSIKQLQFKQIWREFQSIISLNNLSNVLKHLRRPVGLLEMVPPQHNWLPSPCLCFCAELQAVVVFETLLVGFLGLLASFLLSNSINL